MKKYVLLLMATGISAVGVSYSHAQTLSDQWRRQQNANTYQRQQEAYTQTFRDAAYQQRIDAIRNRPSRYDFGAAREQSERNWTEDRTPLTYAEREAIRRSAEQMRQREAEQARLREAEARREAYIAGVLERHRLWAEQAKAERDAEIRRMRALDERAQAGDASAAIEAAATMKDSPSTELKIIRYERAASVGDIDALRQLVTVPLAYATTPAQREKWEAIAVEKGEPHFARESAQKKADLFDFAGAAAILDKAATKVYSQDNMPLLCRYHAALGHADIALLYFKASLKDPRQNVSGLASLLPVTPETAPEILAALETQSLADGERGDEADLLLADIYSGFNRKWQGRVTPDSNFIERYRAVAAAAPTHYNAVQTTAARRLAYFGYPDEAAVVFETAMQTCQIKGVAYSAAAAFWSGRTDGKADGERAMRLYETMEKDGYRMLLERGDIYRYGKGVTPDLPKAIAIYREGEAKEDIGSVRRLARLIFDGEGLPKNEAQAIEMLQKASEYRTTDFASRHQAAFDAAQMRLVIGARTAGVNGKPDYKSTMRSLESEFNRIATTALEPDPRAMEILGNAYIDGNLGIGSPADKRAGWQWLERAANAGITGAQVSLGYRALDAAKPSKNETRQAFAHFLSAAESGDVRGGLGLGLCYAQGFGTAKNPAQAKKWFRWAGDSESIYAKLMLSDAPPPMKPSPKSTKSTSIYDSLQFDPVKKPSTKP